MSVDLPRRPAKMPTVLAAAERRNINRLDAGDKRLGDPRPLQGMRRHQIQLGHGARDTALLIQRLAQFIDHAAKQLVANGHAGNGRWQSPLLGQMPFTRRAPGQ